MKNLVKFLSQKHHINILRKINESLAIISVVSLFRRYKSWLANVCHDGFDLGVKMEGCELKLTNKKPNEEIIQKRFIVLDNEEIDVSSKFDLKFFNKKNIINLFNIILLAYNTTELLIDINWPTKLFLFLVISSILLYIINRIVGIGNIRKLHLMTNLSKFIKKPEHEGFLPRLVILLRDSNFENPDRFTLAATVIRQLFCDFDVYGLSPLECELHEESLVKFLENIVGRMNNSSIPSECESIIQFVAQEAIKESISKYKERTNTLINEGRLPMLWDEFEKLHNKYISEVNKIFFAKIIGSPTQIGKFSEQLNETTLKLKEKLMERNSFELTIYNENIAKLLWVKHIEIGLNKNEKSFKDIEEFQEALKLFESDYNESMKKSPEATRIIASYRQNQYLLAIDHVTQSLRYAKKEADKLRFEAEAREEILRLKIEALKRKHEEYEKNANKKIFELQTNIEQQKKSQEMKQRFIEEKDCTIKEYRCKIKEIEKMNEDNKKVINEYHDKIKTLALGNEQLEASLIQFRINLQDIQKEKEKLLNNKNNKRKLSFFI
ncbi:hypothetical protein RclHR1_06730010 [Rhizophagus clarus]|uniref:Guanylate-binding protein n=1 Tax=Rhizophagus clarus TaxID=94130 RepID=A0A2Z6RU51_9GLOM|nr:hypothetical protein RclHR1_06730010 [Rhizophagus clarus]GES72810.1 guanylate-binding protein [Rhizophagus clarus]